MSNNKQFAGYALSDYANAYPERTTINNHRYEKVTGKEGLHCWKKYKSYWEQGSVDMSLPYNFYQGCAVVYKDEIYILGGSYNAYTKGYCYKFTIGGGGSWTSVTSLPMAFYEGCAVVYNDKIYILGSKDSTYSKLFCAFNGTSWSSGGVPYEFYDGCAVVYRDEIHILGCNVNNSTCQNHYKYNGSSWTSVSTLPYKFGNGNAVVYDDCIYIVGTAWDSSGGPLYKWNGISWTRVAAQPYPSCTHGSAVVIDDCIHVLGSNSTTYMKNHYFYTENGWTKDYDCPFEFFDGSVVLLGGEGLCFLGSYASSSTYTKIDINGYTISQDKSYLVDDQPNKYPGVGYIDGYHYRKIE